MMCTINRVSRLSSLPHLGRMVGSGCSFSTSRLLKAASSIIPITPGQQLVKPTTCLTQSRQLSYFNVPGPKDISEQTADIPKGVTIVFQKYVNRNTELKLRDKNFISSRIPSGVYYMTNIYYNKEKDVFTFRGLNRLAEVKVVDLALPSSIPIQPLKLMNGFIFQGNYYILDHDSTFVLDRGLYTKFVDNINGKDSKNRIDNGVSLDKEKDKRHDRMQNNWNKLKAKKL